MEITFPTQPTLLSTPHSPFGSRGTHPIFFCEQRERLNQGESPLRRAREGLRESLRTTQPRRISGGGDGVENCHFKQGNKVLWSGLHSSQGAEKPLFFPHCEPEWRGNLFQGIASLPAGRQGLASQ